MRSWQKDIQLLSAFSHHHSTSFQYTMSKIGPESKLFDGHLRRAGVLWPTLSSPPPRNVQELRDASAQSWCNTASSSLIQGDFVAFRNSIRAAQNEQQVTDACLSRFNQEQYVSGGPHTPFDRICTRRPLSPRITVAKPDLFDAETAPAGFHMPDSIADYVQVMQSGIALVLPNFFIEFKGPAGCPKCCQRQAFHNGALGARALHQMRQYGALPDDELFNRHAYTISICINARGKCSIYAIRVERTQQPPSLLVPSAPTATYHIHMLSVFNMLESVNEFHRGFETIRNLRSWARQKRQEILAFTLQACDQSIRSSLLHIKTYQPSRRLYREVLLAEREDETYSRRGLSLLPIYRRGKEEATRSVHIKGFKVRVSPTSS